MVYTLYGETLAPLEKSPAYRSTTFTEARSTFEGKSFKEVVTVANVLTCVETEPKWIYYFDYTNVANENCEKFCIEEVFKCRERRMI